MEREYSETLQRIILHRKMCHVSQIRMGEFLGMSQSQYSKMELGRLEIPFWVIEKWAKIGWDVDYFVTGRQQPDADVFGLYRWDGDSAQNRQVLFRELMWMTEHGGDAGGRHLYMGRRALQQLLDNPDGEPVLCGARRLAGLSQEVMSHNLGVGLRKYRRMEQGTEQPDLRIMVMLYGLTGYIPWLFIDYEEGVCRLAQYIWMAMGESSHPEETEKGERHYIY